MDVRTRDGKLSTRRIDVIYGHPSNPLSREDLIAKFKDCAGYAKKPLAGRKIEQLAEKILALEEMKDIKEITGLLN